MARIGFVGLGNMGWPMFQNLVKAGHSVKGFDIAPDAARKVATVGGQPAGSIGEACGAEIIISMLPSGQQAKEVYLATSGILEAAKRDWRSVSAVTVGGADKSISPSRRRIARPVRASAAARHERTRKLTSRLASSSLPPKYPPIAPAPTTRTRISLSDGLGEIRRRNLFEDGAKLDRRVLTECAFEAALRCSPARTGFGDSSLSYRC
jgi:hypothetical protein